MNVAIVGHGPSLTKANLGQQIDDHDKVIRQKMSQDLLLRPEMFGRKVDAVCCSMNLVGRISEWDAPEYWVFIDSRFKHYTDDDIDSQITFSLPRNCTKWDRCLCDWWNAVYRERRTPFEMGNQQEAKPSSDSLGHLHMSAGLHTLIYACQFLKPDSITLAGYDSIMSGKWNWSLARGPEWQQYPDHRFDVEHEMLPLIEEAFGVEIKGI